MANSREQDNKKSLTRRVIAALIDDDIVDANFEQARATCDVVEEEIKRARQYMDIMDTHAGRICTEHLPK